MAGTAEQRRIWGEKGAKVRKAKRLARAADPLYAIREALPDAFANLVKASKGEGRWRELGIKDQLTALLKVVEYGMGKAVTLDKMTPKNSQEEGDGTEEAGTLTFT